MIFNQHQTPARVITVRGGHLIKMPVREFLLMNLNNKVATKGDCNNESRTTLLLSDRPAKCVTC